MLNRNRRYALVLLRLAVAALFLAPLLWAMGAALRPAGVPLAAPFLSVTPTLDSFARLFRVLPVGRFTLNSLRVVVLAVPLTLITASWAGYAMARLPRPSQRRWVLVSLLVLMVPAIALWPARFLVYSRLGLTDSIGALIAPAFMGSSPFFVLMFYRAFRRIPPAIYDAARIDGAGVLETWRRVALPIARPTAFAVAILTFIFYWGDFLSPLLYLSDARDYTLPVGLELLEQLGRTDYSLLMAGALWATLLPVVLIVVIVSTMALKERQNPQKEQNS
ncbi:carbohydrate ABC transporter permease [Promineifilum sp.]|uniref:carbohydrate ABC transporter permease n=1 Tax=Promineifilum sp. TaxID=2664178 RepID=UPI0035AED9FC